MDELDQATLDARLEAILACIIQRRNTAIKRLEYAVNLKAPTIIIGMCEDRLLAYQKQLLMFIAPESEEAE